MGRRRLIASRGLTASEVSIALLMLVNRSIQRYYLLTGYWLLRMLQTNRSMEYDVTFEQPKFPCVPFACTAKVWGQFQRFNKISSKKKITTE